MVASSPEMLRPATVIVLLLPTFLSANVAVADAVDSVTASPETTPESAAEPLFRSVVAELLPSYTLLLAVMPVTVRVFAVIDAVVVG